MTIWISKPLAALSIFVMLGACEGMDTKAGLLASLAPPADAALPTVPLTQALMMRGKMALVPPRGYCIDPDSLTQSFALMARCDTLGAANGGTGAPAGILTVSLSPGVQGAVLPSAQDIATASGLSDLKYVQQSDIHVLFQASGAAPSSDLSTQHWRTAAQVGGFTMGAALYGPEGRRAISAEGASLLRDLIKRSIEKTNAS